MSLIKANLTKQDQSSKEVSANIMNNTNEYRQIAIRNICSKLTLSEFDEQQVYQDMKTYLNTYGRWLYSVISNYLFSLNEKDRTKYISNLNTLLEYSDKLETKEELTIKMYIEKLWDHSNLAIAQVEQLHDSEDTFSARFQKNLIPFKSEFTHEMNMQFISLIAIFTALSFIVFGGISSLDNIFNGAKDFPILILMIMGSIWGLFICNLVFVFMLFVSKFTKLSLKMSEKEDASLSEKYPFIVWCNYIFLLILSVSSWLYYVDYSNSGGWLLNWSKAYPKISCFMGSGIIAIIFGGFALLILHHPKKRKEDS